MWRFIDWANDRLVAGWRCALRMWSLQMHTFGTLIVAALVMVPTMPAEVQALVPLKYRVAVIGAWYVGGIWARLKKQKGVGDAN